MLHIEPAELPLHWAINPQDITQPIVGGTSAKGTSNQPETIKAPLKAYFIINSLEQNECVMFSIESQRQWA